MSIKSTRIIGSIKGTKFGSTKRTGGGTRIESGGVTSGLIINYDFGNPSSWNGSGTTVTDLSGTNNTGTLAFSGTAPAYSSENGGSVVFIDSFSQYLYTTTQYTNPQTFSIGAWFKTAAGNGTKIIGFQATQTGTGASAHDRQIYIGTDGKLYFGVFDGAVKSAISPLTYNDNNWYYVMGTYGGEGTTVRLYVNGVSVATNTASNAENYSGYWRIGAYTNSWTNGTTGYYIGNIGVVQVYNRGLSSGEVLQNFNDRKGRFGL
jgi:hypothetical protein